MISHDQLIIFVSAFYDFCLVEEVKSLAGKQEEDGWLNFTELKEVYSFKSHKE